MSCNKCNNQAVPLINFLMADVWAEALNAFSDRNLWSIQDPWKLLMPEMIQFKKGTDCGCTLRKSNIG